MVVGLIAALLFLVITIGGGGLAAWKFNLLGRLVAKNDVEADESKRNPADSSKAEENVLDADQREAVQSEATDAQPGDNPAKEVGLPEKLHFSDWPLALMYSADGSHLAAAGETGANIWHRSSGKMTRIDHHVTRDEYQFRLSPNGTYVAIIGRDPQMFSRFHGGVWSTSDGKQVFAYEWSDPPYGVIPGFAFSPKETYFASLAPNNAIVVTNLTKGNEAARLEGHTARIGALTFSADEKFLFSGSGDTSDGTTRQWEVAKPQNSNVLITGKAVGAIAALPDGKTLVTSGYGEAEQWELTDDGGASLAQKIPETATSLQVGSDGISVYLMDPGKVAAWDTKLAKLSQPSLQISVASPDELRSASLSADGKSLCVLSRMGLAIWDVPSRQRRVQFTQKGDEIFANIAALSPDGSQYAAIESDGTLVQKQTGGAIVAPTQILALNSGVRGLSFGRQDEILAIDLIPNGVPEHDPDFSLAFRQGRDAYMAFDRKLGEESGKFSEIRDRARDALVQRVQNENRGNVDLMAKKRDAATLEFDEETRKVILEKFGEPKQEALAKLQKTLRDKFGASPPWGEVAAIWKLGAPSPEIILSQPHFEPHEFPYNRLKPDSLGGPTVLDPVAPLGVGKWTKIPKALVSQNRVLWFDRLQGAVDVNLDSLKSVPLNEPDLEIHHWLLSPDGKQLFVRGVRKIKREIEKPNTFGNTIVEVAETKDPVCGIFNLQSRSLVPLRGVPTDSNAIDACFTPDSKRLIVRASQSPIEGESRMNSLHQFDVADGKDVGMVFSYPEGESLREMAVSPDGKWLAVVRGRQNAKLYLIDLATGKERPTTAPEHVAQPTFSPDSKTLAIVATEQQLAKHEIQMIDLARGQARATIKDWNTFVHALAFSPDSRTLVVGGGSSDSLGYRDVASSIHFPGNTTSEMRMYHADTGAPIASLAGHSDLVTCLAFDQSGARLASGSFDQTVKIWDIAAALKAAKENTPKLGAPKPLAAKPTVRSTDEPRAELSESAPVASAAPASSAAAPDSGNSAAAAAKPIPAKSKFETNSLGMKLTIVPPGEFMMGTRGDNLIDLDPGERPQHRVRITKPIAIGTNEVTVGQFRTFVDATRHATDAEKDGAGSIGYDPAAKAFTAENRPEFTWKNIGIEQSDDCPVTNVSWNDAKAFCTWLSGKEGKRYRLPTEAEWEYCCRAGSNTRFSTGEQAASVVGHGNIGDASLRKIWPAANWTVAANDGYACTAPVGKFKPNAFGLYDMVGNVAEWCEDYYDAAYYANSPENDPTGASSGETRSFRGGSWLNDDVTQRPSLRFPGWDPSWRNPVLGFRVVREVTP
jgi:sulfatase modifying factor 1